MIFELTQDLTQSNPSGERFSVGVSLLTLKIIKKYKRVTHLLTLIEEILIKESIWAKKVLGNSINSKRTEEMAKLMWRNKQKIYGWSKKYFLKNL